MKPHIWLFQDGEPLPIDKNAHLMRTGLLAERLVREGFRVTWWTSRFDHTRKVYRDQAPGPCVLSPDYSLHLLDGPSYRRNLSLKRIRHYRACASHFEKASRSLDKPDIILASYPSPELCHAASRYAKKQDVPCVVDVRDPWPAIFAAYLPPLIRWAVYPLCLYYQFKFRAIVANATGITAVSKAMLDWASRASTQEAANGSRQKFYIGYNAFTPVHPIEAPEGFSEQKPLVCLFISSCGKSYDGFTLIEAARRLSQKAERRIRFIIAGDGEMKTPWMEKANGLENVQFTGRLNHSEIQSRLLQAHVGLVLMQGGIARFWLGNKIFEYLAASLVLINNVPNDAAEIVDNHHLGVNIVPKKPALLVEILEKFLNNPSLIKDYRENSRKAFSEHFERDKIYDRYVGYLKKQIIEYHDS